MQDQKKAIATVAAAGFIAAALWWAWSTHRQASQAAGDDRAPVETVSAPPSRVASASARAEPLAGISSSPTRLDDAECVVKAPVAPTVPDAAPDGAASSVAEAAAPLPDPALAAAKARLVDRLRASPDPYANAVAAWLAMPRTDAVADADTETDSERARDAALTTAWAQGLASLAVSTHDPRLYTLAFEACQKSPAHGCPSISARQWAAIDPDNAMPWLFMVDEAAQQNDLSGMKEAMFHVEKSPRLQERGFAPLQPIVDAAGADALDMKAAQALAIDAIGLSAAQAGPQAASSCRWSTPANANTFQQCAAIVDLMENRADSLTMRNVGASVDFRMTGNQEPSRRVGAAMGQLASMNEDLAAATGCADLRGKLARMRRMAVAGEAELVAPALAAPAGR